MLDEPVMLIDINGTPTNVVINWNPELGLYLQISGKTYSSLTGKSSLAQEIEKDGFKVRGWT